MTHPPTDTERLVEEARKNLTILAVECDEHVPQIGGYTGRERLARDIRALLAALTSKDEEIKRLKEWAGAWHSAVETMLTVAGLSSALSASEACEAMRDRITSAEALALSQAAEIEALNAQRDEALSSAAIDGLADLMLELNLVQPASGRWYAFARRTLDVITKLCIRTSNANAQAGEIERLRGALEDARSEGRAEAYDDMAAQHEEDAQEYNRLRDPGMANHQRKYARDFRQRAEKVRAALSPPLGGGQS